MLRRLLLTLCLALGLAGGAQARELLVVGTAFPRIFELDAEGPNGLGVELLRRAAARLGHGLRFEIYPWLRAQAMVEQGQADILVGPYRTPEREQRFLFSPQAFYEDALVFYARRGRASAWQGDYAALVELSVGQVQGWAYGEAFERERGRLQRLSTVRDVATGLQMLRLGRLDLLASNERNTEPVLQRLGLARELQPLAPPLGQLRGHFAFPRHAEGQALRDALDQAMSEMRTRGELRELGRRWNVKIPE
ncbi:transporter substrate-binding domain-containing protein [Roseateles sp. DAIF2]|uniref:substrate-binding periplasmic protein n=1 Tax=Roseateles sp. DAIF2 TaxID=2714952 RepID=UPI0018A30CB1|nr:transporter substrate-binding domain-containing protein [Roseateles sp. DAIF2]QPF72033.1 transporter substrate-binding domain-containing protein [Roseateles sp. DAIF2]